MKKILILGPILSEWSDIRTITETLHFLSLNYELSFIDPLVDLTINTKKDSFFVNWEYKIQSALDKYDAFFGFSLGGVILQHCFPLLEKQAKPVILFSVPSFSDDTLTERLNNIINLIEKKEIINAINQKNCYVFYPYPPPLHQTLANPKNAALRLLLGLQFIIKNDSRPILQTTKLKYLHLIGEQSQLVNHNNIHAPSSCQLVLVPQSGMRVLQDNLMHCIDHIHKFLEDKLS